MSRHPQGDWRHRAYRSGDERAIVELFREAFGRAVSEDYWRWKLKTRPSPVENVGLAVTGDDDRLVFHIGGIPCPFQMGSDQTTVMVAVDAMTAPPYRRRGLLAAVGRDLFDRWGQAGIPLALGLPNEQYNKSVLGWESLFPLRWLQRPLRPERLLARRLGLSEVANWRALGVWWNRLWKVGAPAALGVAVRELDAAGPELDDLWRRCRDAIRLSVVRDRAWVRWRYFLAPHVRYRVLLAERGGEPTGYAAFHVRGAPDRRWGMIAELFAAPGDTRTASALIGEIIRRLDAEDVEGVSTLAVPRTWLYRTFRRSGFVFGRHSFMVECAPFASHVRLGELRQRDAWYLVGGDFDVI